MKKLIFLAVLCLGFVSSNAQQFNFSDSAVVSLITCSPGPEVYAKFGHTAIRINDRQNNLDLVFNYGIFSFQTKNFYYKFIKGETDYCLGVYDINSFLPEYEERNSTVTEQILNLTVAEKRHLFELLSTNYLPQNRVYRYNFVFDNCATRPRDKIVECIDGFTLFNEAAEIKTFRQWVGTYVGTDTWLKFGIDLVFGLDADKLATVSESMFLPEVLMSSFHSAQIKNHNGSNRKLVSQQNVLVQQQPLDSVDTDWWKKPFAVFCLLLLFGVFVTFAPIRRKRIFKVFDSLLLFSTGAAGVIVFFLMFFSIHPLVKWNLNILWLNPFNVAAAVLIWFKPLRKYMFYYQLLNLLLLVAGLIAFALSIQTFNMAAFPIIVLLILRYSRWVAKTKRKLFPKMTSSLENHFRKFY